MVVTAMPGCDKEESTLANLSRMTREAHKWGLPVLGEMVPGGFNGPPETRGTEAVAIAARLGAELGADFIKAPYCDDYRAVTSSTFAPVVILGGAKGDERLMLANILDAIDSGAKGVAIGRNVFQCEDPTAMTAAIALADRLDAPAILAMHAALVEHHDPTIAGTWRSGQVWIGSSNYGPHTADFVPPHHTQVAPAIDDLVCFMHRDDLPVLSQAAIAHAQFETDVPITQASTTPHPACS